MEVLSMFIGRERELASLNKLYNSGKFEFVVLYGRRRYTIPTSLNLLFFTAVAAWEKPR